MVLSVAACGGSDDNVETFATYQDCFDDQFDRDGKEAVVSMVECCLDAEVGGVLPVCRDTEPDCVNFITNNLANNLVGIGEITEACQQYIAEREAEQAGE